MEASRPPPGTSWLRRVDWIERRMPRRTYASERDLRAQGSPSRGRLLRLVGAVTVILLVDLAVGTFLLDTPTTGSTPGGDPAEIPALAGVPHVRPMMTEFFGARVGMYDPFLEWRLADYDGDHLNIAGGERASYESSVPGEPIVVWFFGASTMYWYGQRDEHIPSSWSGWPRPTASTWRPTTSDTGADRQLAEAELFTRLLGRRELPTWRSSTTGSTTSCSR